MMRQASPGGGVETSVRVQALAACVFSGVLGLAQPPVVTAQVAQTAQDTLELQALQERAEGGDPEAQFGLGMRYANGQGVPQDYAQAAAWYRKAADRGIAQAQHNLGLLYDNGRGVLQDYVEAHMWLNLAASRVSGADQTGYANDRDALAERMSSEQIADVQQRARTWAEQKIP